VREKREKHTTSGQTPPNTSLLRALDLRVAAFRSCARARSGECRERGGAETLSPDAPRVVAAFRSCSRTRIGECGWGERGSDADFHNEKRRVHGTRERHGHRRSAPPSFPNAPSRSISIRAPPPSVAARGRGLARVDGESTGEEEKASANTAHLDPTQEEEACTTTALLVAQLDPRRRPRLRGRERAAAV
jgi:hypothetical protein